MNAPENSLKIHNFYLIGKENYELGKYPDKISHRILPPARFNFGETIQEIGLDIKLEYKNFKYYEENESIVSFEPFHFKDFDSEELNIWTYFELLFHQWFLFGVSFNSNKIEIYDRLRNYLVNLYGDYKEIPDQDNSIFKVAWFFDVLGHTTLSTKRCNPLISPRIGLPRLSGSSAPRKSSYAYTIRCTPMSSFNTGQRLCMLSASTVSPRKPLTELTSKRTPLSSSSNSACLLSSQNN